MRVFLNDTFRTLADEFNITFSAPADDDAGYDLYATEEVTIAPGGRGSVPTGVHVEIPPGYVGLVKDRSSVASAGIHTLAGVIDAGYRGEVKLVLLNTNSVPLTVERGRKIAQMIVVAYYGEAVETVATLDDLTNTERGQGGFGSTGE